MTTYRLRELSLLVLPATVLTMGIAMLTLVRPEAISPLEVRVAVGALLMFVVAHVALTWLARGSDQVLLPIVAMLSLIGLLMAGRLSVIDSGLMVRQGLWIAIGLTLTVAILFALKDVAVLQSYKYSAAVLGLILVGITFLLGTDPNNSGVRGWLGFQGVYFQPSEILKVLLVVFLAGYLEDKKELLSWSSSRFGRLALPPIPYLGPMMVMWGASMLLLVGQKDLGPALLLYCVALAMLYVASARGAYVWWGLVAFLVGGFLMYLIFGHVRERVEVWLDPWSHASAEGFQIVQGLVGLAVGGVIGSGLGYGYPGFIPAVQTDYIISAIGEELGLAGTLSVVALYVLLVARGFRIAMDARDDFSTLLATGLTTVLGVQAIVILAGTLKLAPLTGITLPFVSYGGSSIVTNFIIVAILLRISASGSERHGA